MKKKIICIFIVLAILFAGPAFAGNYASGVAKRMAAAKNICDKKCAKEDSSSMYITRAAQSEYIEFLDNELNAVYKRLITTLPQNEKIKLRNQERQWIKTRENAAQKSSEEFEGGSLEIVEYGATYIKYSEKRLIQLANYYDRVHK